MSLRNILQILAVPLLITSAIVVPFIAAPPAQAAPTFASPSLIECTPAQIRATERWWFFGNKAGLDFGVNGSAPIPIQGNTLNSQEGTIVVSDAGGNLMFWSNGQTVINKNQAVMQNGSGLLGNNSSTQVVAAFPIPAKPQQYYVVTTDALATVRNG